MKEEIWKRLGLVTSMARSRTRSFTYGLDGKVAKARRCPGKTGHGEMRSL